MNLTSESSADTSSRTPSVHSVQWIVLKACISVDEDDLEALGQDSYIQAIEEDYSDG